MLLRSNRLRRLRREQSGATATEFAIIMPVFVMMVFGLFEVSVMMFRSASVQWALERAARQVVINPDVTEGEIKSLMISYLQAAGAPSVIVTAATETIAAVEVVRVNAHYEHEVKGPFIEGFTVGFDFSTIVPKAPGA